MKRQAYTMIAMIVLVGSMAVAAQAQTGSRIQLVANIGFDFNIGSKTMPAGVYTVRQINPSSDRAVLLLKSEDGKASLVQMNRKLANTRSQEAAKLVFNRYGARYFFSQAWIPGNDGLFAGKSGAERATQKEMTANRGTETVALRSR